LTTAIETFHANGRYAFSHFFEQRFGVKTLVGAKDRVLEEYVRHNEEAAAFLEKRGANFLKFNSVGDQGWETLCPFLGCAIPAVPYPHANMTVSAPVAQDAADATVVAEPIAAQSIATQSNELPESRPAESTRLKHRIRRKVREFKSLFGLQRLGTAGKN
jgi:hypothetical protein